MSEDPTIWTLPVTPEARTALEGVDAPDVVTLRLRVATLRDLRPLDTLLGRVKTDQNAALEAAAQIIVRRADPPVSIELAREVAADLTPIDLAELVWAFKEGRRDTEGKLRAAAQQTLNGMSETLLNALAAAPTLSSSGSTG